MVIFKLSDNEGWCRGPLPPSSITLSAGRLTNGASQQSRPAGSASVLADLPEPWLTLRHSLLFSQLFNALTTSRPKNLPSPDRKPKVLVLTPKHPHHPHCTQRQEPCSQPQCEQRQNWGPITLYHLSLTPKSRS